MLGLMLVMMAQVVPPAPVLTTPPAVDPQAAPALPDQTVLALPDEWANYPELKLQRRLPEAKALSSFVRDEVRAGRCAASGNRLRVDLSVLVAANGQLRRIRPHAIGCPTVEQYASGVMLRKARSNVAPPGEERWYRTQLIFAWQ